MYFYIFLAIFTKAPAGIIVPFGTIFVFLYLENNFAFLKKIHIRRGMFILGIFIVIWVCGIIISPEGKEYILIMLKQEAAGRILKAKTHIKPFYYYLKMLPVLLFPYGIFFIGSLVYYIKNIRAHKNWEPLEKIGFSWVVLPFICFSLASGKLDIYLLPMFVGMYLMIYSFLLKIKDTKAGEILIKISMILSIFPYIFDRFFNKENYFYKKLLYFPITSVMILGLIMPFTKVYNEKFSLQPIKNIVSNKNIDTVAYKFKDFANMQAEIKNNISFAETEDEVKENIKDNEKIYIISRAKYKKNLKDFNLVYENMNYSLFTN